MYISEINMAISQVYLFGLDFFFLNFNFNLYAYV